MNSTEKQLVKGFLNENWKDFLKYIDEQFMDKLSEPSKPSA